MRFLQFVFELAFIFIAFDLLWNIFMFLLRMAFGIHRDQNAVVYYIFKGISLYLLVSLTALVTFHHVEMYSDEVNQFTYSLIGFLVLYLYITSSMHKSRLKAELKMDERAMRRMRFNGFFLTSALAYYVVGILLSFNHQATLTNWILNNKITSWIFSTIARLYNLLLVRWVIGLLAIFFLVNMLIRAFLSTRMIIFSFFGIPDTARDRLKQRIQSAQEKSTYTDYEEVELEEEPDQRDEENRTNESTH